MLINDYSHTHIFGNLTNIALIYHILPQHFAFCTAYFLIRESSFKIFLIIHSFKVSDQFSFPKWSKNRYLPGVIPITFFQLKQNYWVRNAQGMSNEAGLMILSARDFGPLTLLRQGPITSLRLYLRCKLQRSSNFRIRSFEDFASVF